MKEGLDPKEINNVHETRNILELSGNARVWIPTNESCLIQVQYQVIESMFGYSSHPLALGRSVSYLCKELNDTAQNWTGVFQNWQSDRICDDKEKRAMMLLQEFA